MIVIGVGLLMLAIYREEKRSKGKSESDVFNKKNDVT